MILKVWAGCPLQRLVYGVQSCLGLAGLGWKNAAVHFFGTSMIDGKDAKTKSFGPTGVTRVQVQSLGVGGA